MADAGVSYDGSGTGQVSTGDWYVNYTRPQSLNGWAYAEGDPINLIDPTGHHGCSYQLIGKCGTPLTLGQKIGLGLTGVVTVIGLLPAEVTLVYVGVVAPEVMGPFGVGLDVVVVLPTELLLLGTESGVVRYVYTALTNDCTEGLSVNTVPPFDPRKQ